MKQIKRVLIVPVMTLGLMGECVFAEGASPLTGSTAVEVEAAWKSLPQYKLGADRRGLERVAAEVADAVKVSQRRAAVAKKLAELVQGEGTFEAKDFIIRQLTLVATPAEVPVLAKLLTDAKLAHLGRAALEVIQDDSAGAALRDALSTAKGRELIGVIGSVGRKRDARAVGKLKELLGNDDAGVAVAAATALGEIGGGEAISALGEQKAATRADVRAAVIDAYLSCADELARGGKAAEAARIYEQMYSATQPQRVRTAALRGLVLAVPEKAAPIVLELLASDDERQQALAAALTAKMGGAEVTKTLIEALPKLKGDAQARLVEALGARNDSAARGTVAAVLKSEDVKVRVSAIRALAGLGDASNVSSLAQIAATGSGAEKEAARFALSRLKGAEVDSTILAQIQAAEPAVKVELVKILPKRTPGAAGQLLAIAGKDENESVRIAAIGAAGAVVDEKGYPALVERLLGAASDAERNAARDAIGTAAARLGNRDAAAAPLLSVLSKTQGATRIAVIGSLTRIGGAGALVAVRSELKHSDMAISEAAMRGLTDWPDAAAVSDMLNIAMSPNETHRVLQPLYDPLNFSV